MTRTARATIRFANYLSPLLQETYAYMVHSLSIQTGQPMQLAIGRSLDDFERGLVDVGFLCGLLYVRLGEREDCPVEPLVAPMLIGERYQGRPLYFSDVIVRVESRLNAFADLRGCTWAYNEGASHSGCNLVTYSLLELGLSPSYFGRLIKSGSHLNSLRMVLEGEADAAAIDSHVLDVVLRRDLQLAGSIRRVAMLGPSAIPPVVVARRLAPELKHALREVLTSLHNDPFAAEVLHEGSIARFVPVDDADYDDIRHMFKRVQATDYPGMFH